MSPPTISDPNMCRHLVIHGRVQGVWYRGWLQAEAQKNGIHGWCRNRADKTVEAVVSGAPEAIEKLIAACRIGPPAAQVDKIDVSAGAPDELASDFEVRATV